MNTTDRDETTGETAVAGGNRPLTWILPDRLDPSKAITQLQIRLGDLYTEFMPLRDWLEGRLTAIEKRATGHAETLNSHAKWATDGEMADSERRDEIRRLTARVAELESQIGLHDFDDGNPNEMVATERPIGICGNRDYIYHHAEHYERADCVSFTAVEPLTVASETCPRCGWYTIGSSEENKQRRRLEVRSAYEDGRNSATRTGNEKLITVLQGLLTEAEREGFK